MFYICKASKGCPYDPLTACTYVLPAAGMALAKDQEGFITLTSLSKGDAYARYSVCKGTLEVTDYGHDVLAALEAP